MSIALVTQTAVATSGTASRAITVPAPTAGHLLVVSVHLQSSTGTVTGVTDNAGSTWQKALGLSSTGSRYEIWYLLNASSSITTITVALSLSTNICGNVSQWSGADRYDAANTASLNTSPNRTGALSVVAGQLVVGGLSANSATTRTLSSSGWTALTTGTNPAGFTGIEAYKIVSAAESAEGQWTTASSASYVGGIAAFLPTVTGPLAASAPLLTSALTGDVADPAALAGAIPPLSGALTASPVDPAAVAGTTVPAVGALTGDVADPADLAGATSAPTGTLAAAFTDPAALAGTTAPVVGALTGVPVAEATLAGTIPALTGSLTTSNAATGALAGTTAASAGALTAGLTNPADLAGSTPPPVGDLPSTTTTAGDLSGAAPMPAGDLAAGLVAAAALAALTPPLSGAVLSAAPVAYPLRPGRVVDNVTRLRTATLTDRGRIRS